MKKVQLTKEEKEKIVYNYTVLKYGRKKSGKEFHVSDKIVLKVLKEFNIPIRNIQQANVSKYNIDENFFETQNSNMAYILGILASDGCISKADNQIYIELQRKDRELLEKINDILQNERPVKDYESSRGYECSKIYFYSAKIKKSLKKFHIIPNKTYSDEFAFPELLDIKYYPDFIRGMFDGDGCIKKINGCIQWQIDTSSNDMAEKIKNFLLSKDIKADIQLEKRKNLIMYRVYCCNKNNAAKIFNLLYKDNILFLKRKKDLFSSFLSS